MKNELFTEILNLIILLLAEQNQQKTTFILSILGLQNAIETQMVSIFLTRMARI